MPRLPFPLPSSLIAPKASVVLVVGVGTVWNVAIDGQGYLLSTLDQESPFEFRSYEVQSIQPENLRIDQSGEPGEQTLSYWWPRAQHSWHEGAGQKVFDGPVSSRFAFDTSKGLDIWEDGKITLLKSTFQLDSGTPSDFDLLVDAGFLFLAKAGTIWKILDIDDHPTSSNSQDFGVAGEEVVSMVSDGRYIYVAWEVGGNNGIKRMDMTADWSGSPTVTLVNDLDPEIMGFVKGRLLCGKDNKLYQVIPHDGTATTEPAAIYTHMFSDWTWTGITEGGPGIFCSGFSGDQSEILLIGLDASDIAAGLTLGAPRSVWIAPTGEIIQSIRGYRGTGLVIGTSRGVRVGIISGTDLDVGPVLVETPQPVKALYPYGDFMYFGWSKFDGTSSGIGKLQLGDLVYASDLMATAQGDVISIAIFNKRPVFSMIGTTKAVFAEHGTNYVASGYFTTGEIRFNTYETKVIRFFDALITGLGTLGLEIAQDENPLSPHITSGIIGSLTEPLSVEATRFDLKISLNSPIADPTSRPIMNEWRIRGEPRHLGRFRYIVPLMVYDKMTTMNSREVGFVGYAVDLRNKLMDLWRDGNAVFFQDLDSCIPGARSGFNAKIEDFRFKVFAPPANCKGFGGIALVILRDLG